MTNNLTSEVSEEMILKEGEKLEVKRIDPSSPEAMEIIKNVHERQKKIIELKYKKFENLEIYLPPSQHNYKP